MSEEQNDVQEHGATGSRRSRWTRAGFAGLSGLIAGFCALAVAELASAVVRPEAGPIAAVGGAVIDRTPPAVKDFAVRHFGTADKLVLQLGILALLAVFAVAVGILASRHRRLGSVPFWSSAWSGQWRRWDGRKAAPPMPCPRWWVPWWPQERCISWPDGSARCSVPLPRLE